MIVETPKQLDIQNIAGNFESTEASISSDATAFIIEMMSKSLYSNPIGSICREITSNCFDSHKEAGINKPVVISKIIDDEGTYISFKDVGVGLSPDRISNIYMKYFSSTKRETNDLIGGFGLGSKTPLSYTDSFYIDTIFDGIKYCYLFSKGETVPTLDTLSTEDTTEHNGTEIKIYIKNSNDIGSFEKNLITQLAYFDNVYFRGWSISNYYKIYETDLYKYRNDTDEDEMHICLGKVIYPIDWHAIDEIPIGVPVGIKFEIGDLVVTPNRENLRYTDEVKALVKNRVQIVKQDLITTFEQQNKPYTNFKEWYAVRKQKPFIRFGNEDKLYLSGIDVDKKHRLTIFKDVNFYYELENYFDHFYSLERQIVWGKESKKLIRRSITEDFVNHSFKYAIVERLNTSALKNASFQSGYLIKRKKSEKFLGSYKLKNEFISKVDKKKEVKTGDYIDDNGEIIKRDGFGDDNLYFNLGLAMKVHKINKRLRRIFAWSCSDYDNVPKEWTDNYRREQRENNLALQRKKDGKVFIKDIHTTGEYELTIREIDKFTGIIVYGNRDDKAKLERAERFLHNFSSLTEDGILSGLNVKAAKVVLISKQCNKYFQNRSNMVHVDNLYSDHKLFRRLASSYKIEEFFKNFLRSQRIDAEDFVIQIGNIHKATGGDLNNLLKYRKQNYNKEIGSDSTLKEMVLKIANQHNYFDPVIESIFERVDKWFEGVEILRFTEINEDSLPSILKYLREKGKRLNTEYYLKYVPEANDYAIELQKKQFTLIFNDDEVEKVEGTKFQLLTRVA